MFCVNIVNAGASTYVSYTQFSPKARPPDTPPPVMGAASKASTIPSTEGG